MSHDPLCLHSLTGICVCPTVSVARQQGRVLGRSEAVAAIEGLNREQG